MKKFLLLILMVFAVLPIVYAEEYCQAIPVQYYGPCDTTADINVYKEDGTLIAQNLYSTTTGCNNGFYRMLVIGGRNCILNTGDTILFKLNDVLAGVDVFEAEPHSEYLNLSTGTRKLVIIDNDEEDIKAIDEEGVDVSKYGSTGGSSSISLVKFSDENIDQEIDNTNIAQFQINLEKDIVVGAGTEDRTVYVDIPSENAEVLVPVYYGTNSLKICTTKKSIKDCENVIKLKPGQSYQGIFVEPAYRLVDGKEYYVIKGLNYGAVAEFPLPSWMAYVGIGILITVAFVGFEIKKNKKWKRKNYPQQWQ